MEEHRSYNYEIAKEHNLIYGFTSQARFMKLQEMQSKIKRLMDKFDGLTMAQQRVIGLYIHHVVSIGVWIHTRNIIQIVTWNIET
jgi:hypothetical protein